MPSKSQDQIVEVPVQKQVQIPMVQTVQRQIVRLCKSMTEVVLVFYCLKELATFIVRWVPSSSSRRCLCPAEL